MDRRTPARSHSFNLLELPAETLPAVLEWLPRVDPVALLGSGAGWAGTEGGAGASFAPVPADEGAVDVRGDA